ncbi:hypothetical protein IWQ57_003924 [Coemansia nantahalensis]|uniref:Uncharacterized protein n=1 Tax=Coemansia nantahalensis TaxID=2789366 RepID=A0ACC1JUK6_9FUNG|nr:hypothetical protein IWQ57_003924 [Coemansia nantahalensis]
MKLPSGERKSGIPDDTEMPAPVITRHRWQPCTARWISLSAAAPGSRSARARRFMQREWGAENTAGTVVTITGPGVTKTTVVGPPPTIDDPNGSKADVGASSNLTSIIVASTVTAVALLACTVLFYVYRYRKNRRTYGDDDFFAKGMGGVSPHSRGANTMTTTSPFIPPGQPSSDGYVAEPGHGRFVSVGDNSHLLANQPYRQVHPAPVHYRQQPPPPHNPFSLQPHGQ